MGVAFTPLDNREALKYFGDKVPISAADAAALSADAKARAFWVSGVAKDDLAAGLHSALLRNIRDGKSVGDFRQEARDLAERQGWSGASPYRLDFIYRENVNSAYQAGRYAQMTDPSVLKMRPFWQYLHFPQERYPRPAHLALDKKILPADDPFWQTWYPPNGYGCKCSVRTLSQRQAAGQPVTKGEDIVNRMHELPDGSVVNVLRPDPGFDSSPLAYWQNASASAFRQAAATASWQPVQLTQPEAPLAKKGAKVGALLAPGATLKSLRAAAGVGANGAVIRAGADGAPVLISDRALQAASVERAWLPNLAAVIEKPDEVWLAPVAKETDVAIRRHYLKVFGEGRDRVVMVATVQRGTLVSYRAVTPEHADAYRTGKLLLRS